MDTFSWSRTRELIVVTLLVTACASSGGVDSVRDAHERRFRAMVQNDLAALGSMLADDVVYIHSTGEVESKQKFLDHLRSGTMRYRAIDAQAPSIRLYGDAAIVTGRSKMAVTSAGTDRDIDIVYTALYRRAGEGWQLVSWQSTRVP